MDSESSYYDHLGQIVSYALSVDDVIEGSLNTEGRKGLSLERGGQYFQVSGAPWESHLEVFQTVRVSDLLTRHFYNNIQEAEAILETHGDNRDSEMSDSDIAREAAIVRTKEVPAEPRRRVVNELTEKLVQTNCRHTWLTIGDNPKVWDGAKIHYYIHPKSGSFTVDQYDQSVQSVLNVAAFVKSVIQESIEELSQEDTSTGRGFA